MTFDPVSVVFLFIGFQSVLFSLFLIASQGQKKLSNWLLAGFLVTLASQMVGLLIEFSFQDSDFILGYMCIFGYTYGPLLYLYTVSLINKNFVWQKLYLIHFVPPFLFLFSAVVGYPLCMRIGSLLYLSLVVYISMAIIEIRKYRKVVAQTQSANQQIDLNWLQWTMIIFCLILFSDIIDRFLIDLDFIYGISLVHFALLFLVNWIFYKGLKQPQLFQGITKEEKLLVTDILTDPLMDEEAHSLTIRLKDYMEEEQPFTNADLTLNELSLQLQISPRRLSRVINSNLQLNFIGFINSYRIEMAKERLANPKDAKETVLEVLYEVGFKSKSSFNTLFKQQTGQTPTAYKKSKSNH